MNSSALLYSLILYSCISCSCGHLEAMVCTAITGSSHCSNLMQLRSTNSDCVQLGENNTPGESIILTYLSNRMVLMEVVKPGVAPTPATLDSICMKRLAPVPTCDN